MFSLANNANKPLPIKFPEKVAYGFGDFSSCLLYVAIQGFLMFYYTDYLHIDVAAVATIMFVSRIFDGFSDILMGHIIEKTKSKYGKARAWVLRMIIPYFIGTVMLFSVPEDFGTTAKLIYIFFTYNFAITIVYTAINLSYGVMSVSMTNDSYERSILVIFRMVLAAGGAATISAITMPLVEFYGNDVHAWMYTFMTTGAIGAALFFVTFYFCHERIESAPQQVEKTDSKKSIKSLVTNLYWIILVISMVLICTTDMIFNSVNVYFCKYFLNDAGLVGTYGVIVNVSRIALMIVVLPFLLKIIGKRNCLLMGCISFAGAAAIRYLAPESINAFYITSILLGLGEGFGFSTLFAMIPDTVEYGEYKSGERHEGYIYAGASFGTKVAAGIAPALAGLFLSMGGYNSESEQQTEEALSSIMTCSVTLPIVLVAICFVCLLFYKLDKEYPNILKVLGERHAKSVFENN